ncbi:tRNA (guanosine(37)-N1)-methyltransferase TrmD [Limnobacter humi]|uniref:tRNA (guanine-N(1)-)-methyltransferase n=1 Tax=Limnobacter humi TaxID=1778671 RepID=A0ABT1WGD7_9BURK|nr:tRNA (guanosine(37)-N1)-methyltransferase TrmD [Limnobacter humi]MCQ8896576.1 tRNA (guanosine(37)-N1)-methyltransferase TrmD [Limnobacter humi]
MPGPRFDVITLFPEQFPALLEFGVVGRALKKGLFSLKCWNPRDFTTDPHRTVDDRPYGGGPGMVMLAEPLVKTVQAIRAERAAAGEVQAGDGKSPLIYLTPHGPLLKQADVRHLEQDGCGAILLCGRYEGVDQRFIDHYVDRTFCIGDFVLSGGELPVACLLDAWVRLLPEALNHAESAVQDSFETGLLDCPHYTRPEVFENKAVPEVLLSGNHAKIAGWRFEESKVFTKRHRPDLLAAFEQAQPPKAEGASKGKHRPG